uniref:Uncharacterized protein n=1 Tax=Opuntia streptacantha TaxID=393608 RepID=A0A7C9AF89_OPUST
MHLPLSYYYFCKSSINLFPDSTIQVETRQNCYYLHRLFSSLNYSHYLHHYSLFSFLVKFVNKFKTNLLSFSGDDCARLCKFNAEKSSHQRKGQYIVEIC